MNDPNNKEDIAHHNNNQVKDESRSKSIQELVDAGEITPKQAQDWVAYIRAFDKLQQSDIHEYKIKQALEQAKLLSLTNSFQESVEKIRSKWNITPYLPSEDAAIRELHPDCILVTRAFDSEPSDNELDELRLDLRSFLCDPFDLDWLHDYGLIVAAVCFGITPENILNHWDRIWPTAAKETSPGVTTLLRDEEREQRIKLEAFLTVAYLIKRLKDEGVHPKDLPGPIRESVRYAFDQLPVNNEDLRTEVAPLLLSRLRIEKDDSRHNVQVYLEIKPDTNMTDVKRSWPQVELRQRELYGKQPKSKRKWRTYERDYFIWRKVNQAGMKYEKAYDAWLDQHPDEEPVEITAIIKAVKRIGRL